MIDFASLEMMLMHYAAGGLGPAEALMVAAHLSVNPNSQKKVSAYKAAGAEMVYNIEPAPISDDCLMGVLARIDAPQVEEKHPCHEHLKSRAESLNIPLAIFSVLSVACNHDQWRWHEVAKGVHIIDISICEEKIGKSNGYIRLMRAAPDIQSARHSHNGVEITLVLEGSYLDETGYYKAGDIVIFGENRGFNHAPVSGPEGCLCLVMNEKPVHFTNPLQRFFNYFYGF